MHYGTRTAAILNVHCFVIKSSLFTGKWQSGSVRVRVSVIVLVLRLGLGLALWLQLGIGIGFRRNHSWSSTFTPRCNLPILYIVCLKVYPCKVSCAQFLGL